MVELWVSVNKVLGQCTGDPPMKKGDGFWIRQGDISIPENSSICLWALQSILPLIPAKERKICEKRREDWMWRTHHVQCPDPKGRVMFRIERRPPKTVSHKDSSGDASARLSAGCSSASPIHDLKVVVAEIKGRCTSRWRRGDYFLLKSGRLYIPAGRSICLYALQAVIPFLAAKQRRMDAGDWLKKASRFLCPDPAGNVILRVKRVD